MSTADDITRECAAIRDLLLAKNLAYGDSALDPVRIFSQADPVEQIRVRIDDKLSRLGRGKAAGEDVEQDLLGYLVLLRIARKRAAPSLETPPPISKPQPGEVVPWDEVEDGALYFDRGNLPFYMVYAGRACWMCGDIDSDIAPLLSGGEVASAIVVSAGAGETLEPTARLVARDLGPDPESWRQAMRAHLARESAKP